MGLISFIKNAGSKIFGGEAEAKPAPATTGAMPAPDPAAIDRGRAEALRHRISSLGLEVENLTIKVEKDVVTVGGTVADQATREKVVLACGNTAGIGGVSDNLVVTNPEPEAVYYTVEAGDTLWKIAKEHYGNGAKYPEIFEANKPLLEHPDKIYPGQVLRIPALD